MTNASQFDWTALVLALESPAPQDRPSILGTLGQVATVPTLHIQPSGADSTRWDPVGLGTQQGPRLFSILWGKWYNFSEFSTLHL